MAPWTEQPSVRRGTIGWLVVSAAVLTLPALWWLDRRTLSLAANTLLLAGGVCAMALPVGTVLALLIARTDTPGRRTAGVLLATMLFVPLYVQVAAWDAGFGQQGWFTVIFSNLQSPPLLWRWRGALLVHAAAAVPWVTLFVGLGVRLVRPELEEQALLDGRQRDVFRWVTLPRAAAAAGVAALWVLVLVAGEMTVTDIYQVRTYAEELYTGMAAGDGPWRGAASVLPGTLLVAWLVVATVFLCHRLVPREVYAPNRPRWTFRLGRWRWPAAVLMAALLLLIVGVPLGNLALKAGMAVEQVGNERVRHWSLAKAVGMTATSPFRYRDDFAWSMAIGQTAAVASVVLALPLAWWARRGGLRSVPAVAIAAIGLAVPGPIVALVLIWLLNRPEPALLPWLYDRTILAPVLAVMARSLPPAILIGWVALRSVPIETVEAAAVDGAGPLRRFFLIVLPQRWPAVGCIWLAALAVSIGDLSASYRVLPPGINPLSFRVFQMVHAGVEDQLAGICLSAWIMLAAIGALTVCLALRPTSD